METGNRTAGNRDEHEAPDRCSCRMHVGEVLPDLRRMETMHRNTERHADRHDDQNDTEDRIDLTDDLVDRNKGCDEIIDQDNCQPCGGLGKRSGNALLRQQLDKQSCRAYREHGTDHDQQDNGKDSHDVVHDRSKIDTGYLGDRRTVVSLGKHAGEVIMHSTGKHGTKGNPQKYNRSPQRTLHRAEDGAKSGNVQKLNQKQLPCRHDDIVNAVIDRDSRCLTIVRAECIVHKQAVDKIPAYQNQQTYKETYHTYSSHSVAAP